MWSCRFIGGPLHGKQQVLQREIKLNEYLAVPVLQDETSLLIVELRYYRLYENSNDLYWSACDLELAR